MEQYADIVGKFLAGVFVAFVVSLAGTAGAVWAAISGKRNISKLTADITQQVTQSIGDSANKVNSAVEELKELNRVALDTMRETLAAKDTLLSQYASRIPQLESMLDTYRAQVDELRSTYSVDLRARDIQIRDLQNQLDTERNLNVTLAGEVKRLTAEVERLTKLQV